MGSDPEQDYFADATTNDRTTDLSHLAGSFIARNTAFTYKGKAVVPRQRGCHAAALDIWSRHDPEIREAVRAAIARA